MSQDQRIVHERKANLGCGWLIALGIIAVVVIHVVETIWKAKP